MYFLSPLSKKKKKKKIKQTKKTNTKTKPKKNNQPIQKKTRNNPHISLWDMFKKSKERYKVGDDLIYLVEHQQNAVVEREQSSHIEN